MKQLLILLFAFCSIATNGQHLLTEQQKIDHLIGFVASLKGAVFIRNGIEHSPQAASEHLAMKRKKAGSSIQSAKAFIDKIASKSSITGEYYIIQFANGKKFPCQMVLLNELKSLEEKR